MMRISARNVRHARSQDSGYAMATALLVGVVGFAITAIITAMVLFTVRGSQRGSETVADRAVAEAGIDSALAAIAQSSGTNVPCTISGSLSGAQNADYEVTITYYSAASVLLTCSSDVVSAIPASAVIRSVGTTAAAGQAGSTASRTMEAQVTISNGGGGGGGGGGGTSETIPWAIVSGGALDLQSEWRISTSAVPPQPISVAGNFLCRDNDNAIEGGINVNVQGSVDIDRSCDFSGDIWSGDDVELTRRNIDVTVRGSLKAVGNLTMSRDSTLTAANLAVARVIGGTPTVTGTTSLSPPNPSVGAPPIATFPQLDYNATTWSGWTPVTPATNSSFPCSRTLPSLTSKTVYLAYTGAPGARCTNVNWSGNTTLTLTHDVTIFADRFQFGDTLRVRSSNGSKLRLIVPAQGATNCPLPGNRTITGSFNVEDSASVLLYARGGVTIRDDSDIRGQIVTCQVTSSGDEITFEYVDVGAPGAGGTSPTPSPSPTATSGNYTVTENYRRDA